jgi:hypothetical protein
MKKLIRRARATRTSASKSRRIAMIVVSSVALATVEGVTQAVVDAWIHATPTAK